MRPRIALTLPEDDKANRNRLSRANVGIGRLVEVLEVYLKRSKIQGPSYQLHFVNLYVAEQAEAFLTNTRDLLPRVEISVNMNTDAEKAEILADGEMLKLALINLIENAFKFSAPVNSVKVGFNIFCVKRGNSPANHGQRYWHGSRANR